MGLSAGQARLLTITGRKSDCEFESMRLSHQKIALTRQLADLSNEYQNSLEQTKLIYDFYGTGDTSTQLSYGLLMSPSALNNYMPTLITDSLGRVTLNGKLAKAARIAGIPQEGLGSLPSDAMRDKFIEGLATSGVITDDMKNKILGLPYNQNIGFGGGTTVAVTTDSGNIEDLKKYIEKMSTAFDCSDTKNRYKIGMDNAKGHGDERSINIVNGSDVSKYAYWNADIKDLKLMNLLSDDSTQQYYLAYEGIGGEQTPVYGVALMQNFLTDSAGFIDWLYDEFSAILDLGDGYTGKALEYAYSKTKELVSPSNSRAEELHNYWLDKEQGLKLGEDIDDETQHSKDKVKNFIDPISNQWCGKCSKDEEYQPDCVSDSRYCIGFSTVNSGKGGGDDGNDHATAGLNLNNIAKGFLTYFADYVNGISKKDLLGREVFCVNKGGLKCKGNWAQVENSLVTDNLTFQFTWKTGTDVSSDDLGQAAFYDALFNQLCAKGWTENEDITTNQYLQEMLQSGRLFVSRTKDDGYYYQGNYATDSYIKEIADETLIAQAEAKYNTEKAKLNQKEETLDLKMKNLDTEISSLTTEYDTVKNTISKNIEKSFKRYNA